MDNTKQIIERAIDLIVGEWGDHDGLIAGEAHEVLAGLRAALAAQSAASVEPVAFSEWCWERDGERIDYQSYDAAMEQLRARVGVVTPLAAPVAAQQDATPVDDKSHPRFMAGYDAGMKDARLSAASAEPSDDESVAVLEKLVELAKIVDTAVDDWGETFPDGSCQVVFPEKQAEALETILEYFDGLPNSPDPLIWESGPLRAARALLSRYGRP